MKIMYRIIRNPCARIWILKRYFYRREYIIVTSMLFWYVVLYHTWRTVHTHPIMLSNELEYLILMKYIFPCLLDEVYIRQFLIFHTKNTRRMQRLKRTATITKHSKLKHTLKMKKDSQNMACIDQVKDSWHSNILHFLLPVFLFYTI